MPPNRSKAILVPPVASSSEEDVEYSKIQSTLLNQQSPPPAKSGSHKPLASSSKQPGESELDANEAKRPKKKVGEEGMVTAPVVEEIRGKDGISGKVESSTAPTKKIDDAVPIEVDKVVSKSFGSLLDDLVSLTCKWKL
ncbi:hypothetical protein Gorai_002145 [Gossypium raimondii]|uniref:Uncharacterized protein n=1 Tax=Gossypium raimondii TaxID=29730 RepID=A0A7J8QKW0_GOSRA|nr:hypothetical protein [Gossypium raimondii]